MPFLRPTEQIDWANTIVIAAESGQPNRASPDQNHIDYGIFYDEGLDRQTFNHLHYYENAWINYILQEQDNQKTRITVDGSYVGIGTTSPTVALDVSGTMAATTSIGIGTRNPVSNLHLFVGTATVKELLVQNSGGSSKFGTLSTGDAYSGAVTSGKRYALYSNGVESLTVASNGNLGIGTTNPQHKINVYSTANSSSYLDIRNTNNGDSSVAGVVMNAGANSFSIASTTDSNSLWAGAALVWNASATDMIFANGQEKMRLKYDGKLGIGTATPLQLLHVNGDAKINGTIVNTYGVGIGTTPDSSTEYMTAWGSTRCFAGLHASSGYPAGMIVSDVNVQKWGIVNRPSDGDKLYFSASPTSFNGDAFRDTAKLTIQQDGKVGIGITIPTTTLEVNGTIKGTNIGIGTSTPTAAIHITTGYGATATPDKIDLGWTFSNGVTKDKCKIYLYNNGVDQYGFGIGGSSDIQYHSNGTHDHYINNTKILTVTSTGIDLVGTMNSGTVPWARLSNLPDPSVTLSGDVSGTATMTDLGSINITTAVADDSHAHIWSNIDESIYMSIGAGGIGIGTQSPTYALDVWGFTGLRRGVWVTEPTYTAVNGTCTNSGGDYSYAGVKGICTGNVGVWGEGSTAVYGVGSNTGCYGISTNGNGVAGTSTNSYGVRGESTNSTAVYGTSSAGIGVHGYGYTCGVYGIGRTGTPSIGVYGAGAFYGCEASGGTSDFYASGPGSNYSPFTGSHDTLKSNSITSFEIGMIVIANGNTLKNNVSTTLPEVELCSIIDDKRAFGIAIAEIDMNAKMIEKFGSSIQGRKNLIVNSIGEGQILVTDIYGEIGNGDYITTSTIPGYGGKQSDDFLHSWTVAKCTESIDWDSIEAIDGRKKALVSCTYHCG